MNSSTSCPVLPASTSSTIDTQSTRGTLYQKELPDVLTVAYSRGQWLAYRSGRSPRGRRVTERAQEMFLEYAHYLPERATLKVVHRVQDMVASELGSRDLRTPMTADAVIEHLSHIHSGDLIRLALGLACIVGECLGQSSLFDNFWSTIPPYRWLYFQSRSVCCCLHSLPCSASSASFMTQISLTKLL